MSTNINLFISYSHDDEPYFKVFSERVKKVAKNAEHFEWNIWDDKNIHVGTFWDDEIQSNIKNCNVAMLLVSVGFMASKYIKENEYVEFIRKYKDKGILIVPVVFAPCDFSRWDELGRLQFFKPDGSNYGKAEIQNFTYADLVDFKKTDGLLIPNTNIDRYILDLVKKIEESFHEFLKKSEKEISLQQTLLNSNLNKLSDYPKPSILFTGREKDIKKFQTTFNSFRLFAIEGLGGTGKTQFVSMCIEKLIEDKNKIIWLNGSVQSNFDVFVETAGYGDVLKGEKKTDLALYSGLKDLIEKDERIIFWDNYNDYEDSVFSDFLSFAYQYLSKATIILITKTDPSIKGITSLPIVRLEGLEKDALEYARKLKDSNVRYNSILDADLVTICEGSDGHPLAIEFAMLLMGYGKAAEDIMTHMPEYSGFKKVEEFSKRLFLDIFNHPKTSDEERECFLKCSIFKERITDDEIKFLYDGKDVFYLLVGLIDKLLITSKEGFYEIHPLVRSFSYERLEDKKNIHKKAAFYFITKRGTDLDASLEEKIFYHLSEAHEWELVADFIEKTGRKFIHQGHLGLITELMNRLNALSISKPIFEIFCGDIAQIKGEWDKAMIYFKKASQNVDLNSVKAEGMIKYGEILFRKGNVKEALPQFEEAYIFSKQNNFLKEEARVLNNIGLVYDVFGELEKASDKLTKALNIRISINDKEGIATSLGNIGSIYETRGMINNALEKFEESLKIRLEISDKTGIATSLSKIGSIYETRGEIKEALNKYEESLKIELEIGDKTGIATCLSNIGNILKIRGEINEALEKHEESLKIYNEIGDKGGIASSINLIGSIFNIKGELNEALKMHEESLKIREEIGDIAGIAVSLSMVGGIYDIKGEIKEALKKYEESLKILEVIGDKGGIASCLGNIGSIYRQKGKNNDALHNYEQSLKIRKEIGDKSGIAISLTKIGDIYQSNNEIDEALIKYNESLKISEEIGNKSNISVCLSAISSIYKTKGKIDEALEKVFESLKISEEIGDKLDIAVSFNNVGILYADAQLNRFDLALEYLFKGLSLTTKIGVNSKSIINSIINIRETKIALSEFKVFATQAFDKLSPDMQKYIPLQEFIKEPIHREGPKVGNNDLCPCGSGKKYKHCHKVK